jgi:hypothetical protein
MVTIPNSENAQKLPQDNETVAHLVPESRSLIQSDQLQKWSTRSNVGNPLTDKAPDVEMGEAYNRPPTRAEEGGENKKKGNGEQTPSLNPNATPQRRNMGYRLNLLSSSLLKTFSKKLTDSFSQEMCLLIGVGVCFHCKDSPMRLPRWIKQS